MTKNTPGGIIKPIAERNASWIRRDWIVVGVLFVLLTVMNVTGIVIARDARDAAAKAALIATQTAVIADIARDARDAAAKAGLIVDQTEALAESRLYLQKVAASTGICAVLTSGAINKGEIAPDPVPVENYYNQCIMDRAGVPPPVL